MTFIGIDPGSSGAMAVIREDGTVALDAFSVDAYCRALSRELAIDDCTATVEQVHAMPGQGVTSMFSFGHNLGLIEGMLSALCVPYSLVRPQAWKKSFGLSFPKGTDKKLIKAESIRLAKEKYPDVDLRRTPRCKTDSDGMAEALLIAEYGMTHRVNIPYQ